MAFRVQDEPEYFIINLEAPTRIFHPIWILFFQKKKITNHKYYIFNQITTGFCKTQILPNVHQLAREKTWWTSLQRTTSDRSLNLKCAPVRGPILFLISKVGIMTKNGNILLQKHLGMSGGCLWFCTYMHYLLCNCIVWVVPKLIR